MQTTIKTSSKWMDKGQAYNVLRHSEQAGWQVARGALAMLGERMAKESIQHIARARGEEALVYWVWRNEECQRSLGVIEGQVGRGLEMLERLAFERSFLDTIHASV